ncbi:hypothetical protein BJ875DRAFT_204147 [Amylocarpus encephaloides]|uniref:Uncharacterized protein n=1 Tax=Amylocarpus encephaloides TaxID=45428 RepID=A0A9P7YMZ2_9HELO|nr:hypothetical protein BJ875DRAFT_204147 [Amylocarpus encephaloides]
MDPQKVCLTVLVGASLATFSILSIYCTVFHGHALGWRIPTDDNTTLLFHLGLLDHIIWTFSFGFVIFVMSDLRGEERHN